MLVTLAQLPACSLLGQFTAAEVKMLLPSEWRRNPVPGCCSSPKSRILLQLLSTLKNDTGFALVPFLICCSNRCKRVMTVPGKSWGKVSLERETTGGV